MTFRNFIRQIAGTLPLRTVLIVPFVLQIVGTVGLVGYLSFKSGQKSVEDLAQQLMAQVGERVKERITTYLSAPQQAVAANHMAFETGLLDINDFDQLQRHMWQQLMLSPSIESLYFGNELAEEISYGYALGEETTKIVSQLTGEQLSVGTAYTSILRNTDPGKRKYYLVNSQGYPRKLFHTFEIDNRTTDWYRTAKASKQQTWSPISIYKVFPILGIFAVAPIYDRAGQWQGVFASSFTLSALSTFLEQLDFSPSGRILIMDRSGQLVATSTGESLLVKPEKGEPTQLLAVNSRDPYARDIARKLIDRFGNFKNLQGTQQFHAICDDQEQFFRVTSYQDNYGLDWLVVVVVPESDFLEQVRVNTRTTILLCIVALVGSITLGILTARWITQPIVRLNRAAQSIAQGEWENAVEVNRRDELGQLTQSFNNMARQLKQYFTDLQASNKYLAESESKLHQTIDAIPVGISVHDRTGQLIYANDRGKNLMGIEELPKAQLNELAVTFRVYQAQTDRLYPEERLPIVRALQGEKVKVEDMELRHGDRRLPLEVYGTPLFDETGEIVAAIVAFTDITDRQQAEKILADYNRTLEAEVIERTEELQKAKEGADAANLAKSVFLANMSHELRTPLNAILGFSQFLSFSTNVSPTEKANIEIVLRSGEYLLSLINDVLDLAKIEAGRTTLNTQTFALGEFLKELEHVFRLKAEEKSLYLRVELSPNVPQYICTDAGKLRQILMNLLSNSIKFTSQGGVSVRVSLPDPEESTNSLPTSSGVFFLDIQVEDTGAGIAADELDSIFEAFVQTQTGKQSQQGTGLGLPISRQFAKLMGGNLTVRSEVGNGSLFQLTFQFQPASSGVPEIYLPTRRPIALVPNQPEYRLLIVDDLEINRQLLIQLLEPFGFELRQASNGREAIEIWQEFDPHLIFMDLRMPVMDGDEASQRIKATLQGQSTILIAITASVFDPENESVNVSYYDETIYKPFRSSQIFTTLEKHLGVRYLYEESIPEAKRDRTLDEYKLVEALAALPTEVLLALEQATIHCEIQAVEDAIAASEPFDGTLASELSRLATLFEYPKILSLIEKSTIEHKL